MAFYNNTYVGACLKVYVVSPQFLYDDNLNETLAHVVTEFFPKEKQGDFIILIPNVEETELPVSIQIDSESDMVEITPELVQTLKGNFESVFDSEIAQIEDLVGRTKVEIKFMCINFLA